MDYIDKLNIIHNRKGKGMEIRQIQSFVTITQLGSFSRAAQVLGYSQSAITVQIRLLEEELGVRLFDRMGKKTALTSQGKRFLTCADEILKQVQIAGELKKKGTELKDPLHIGTLTSICFSKFPPILQYFREHHPRVPIRITTASPGELIDMMEHNQLDLVYLLDRSRYSERWEKVMEVPEPVMFVASPQFHLAGQREIPLEQLLREPFLLTERNENYRRELDQFLESRGMGLTPFLEISNTEFIIHMVCENRGITYLPYFAVKKNIEEEHLTVLNVPDFKLQMYRQIFYHKNKWKTPEMEEFIRLARELR